MTRRRVTLPTKNVAPAPIGDQTNHVVPMQVAGDSTAELKPRSRRSNKLRVVAAFRLPPDFELLPGVPEDRNVCRGAARPCPFISCKEHLWIRMQDEQPGNPQAGKQGETTFRASTSTSCALDVADQGAQSFETIGALFGTDPTRERQIAARAIRKLQAAGVDVAEFLEAL